jgi:hypothetical protein
VEGRLTQPVLRCLGSSGFFRVQRSRQARRVIVAKPKVVWLYTATRLFQRHPSGLSLTHSSLTQTASGCWFIDLLTAYTQLATLNTLHAGCSTIVPAMDAAESSFWN